MSRAFSTSAKSLLEFVWKGMSRITEWEDAGRTFVEKNPKLPKIKRAEVKGMPHTSTDPNKHLTLILYGENDARITSVHVYEDGTGVSSKKQYN